MIETKHPGRAAQRRVEGEGEGVDAVDVDPENTRRARVLRGGADRLSGARALHEQHHGNGDDRRQPQRDQLR